MIRTTSTAGPQRIFPTPGRELTCTDVRGTWWPSSSVACSGVFCVVWATRGQHFWAPLHDFSPAARQAFLDECRQLDQRDGSPGRSKKGGR